MQLRGNPASNPAIGRGGWPLHLGCALFCSILLNSRLKPQAVAGIAEHVVGLSHQQHEAAAAASERRRAGGSTAARLSARDEGNCQLVGFYILSAFCMSHKNAGSNLRVVR